MKIFPAKDVGWVCPYCGYVVAARETHPCELAGVLTAHIDNEGVPAEPSVLLEAQSLVHGDRQADYGHPIHDYAATGRIWGAIIERWLRSIDFPLPPEGFPDVDPRIATVMMQGVKLSREAGKHKRDNNVDSAGYAECTQMISDRQRELAGMDKEVA